MKQLAPLLLIITVLLYASPAIAQSGATQKAKTGSTSNQPATDQDMETLKIDTNLVTVPVIASSRTGSYIADLKKEEFKLTEDGVPQEIAFLATVDAPFYV